MEIINEETEKEPENPIELENIKGNIEIENVSFTYEDDNEDVFEVFKDKYNESYKCVLKIKEQIKQIYDYELSKDEQLYLMIHIERITTKATL